MILLEEILTRITDAKERKVKKGTKFIETSKTERKCTLLHCTPSHLSKLSFLHAATFTSNNMREKVVEESESKAKFEEKRKDFF